MRRVVMMILLHAIGLAVLAAAALFVLYGRENTWALLFGKPDLGRVEFETLTRSPWPNDALVCPATLCRARIDREPPVYAVEPTVLRERLRAVLAGLPLVTRVADYPEALEERYVAYTPLMRFPDTIRVRYLPAGPGRSTLALHSQSQLGRADWGTNGRRLDDWLARLAAVEPPVAQP
ncbi:DUF1499 domain-containing protein [Prosthecomicrobium sp. N25]|uniref:DUF1499 domain-containing protein n=1 Tax=Prosthecomicrobium sp. N25 TaxID=3129254 RepID=UPI003076E980